MRKFLLRDLDSALNAASPNDKLAVIIPGTNASGTQDIDVSMLFRNGAIVHAIQLKPVTVTNGVLTSTSAAVTNGAVETLIIGSIHDLQYDGGQM